MLPYQIETYIFMLYEMQLLKHWTLFYKMSHVNLKDFNTKQL